jgi:hypothetical protein
MATRIAQRKAAGAGQDEGCDVSGKRSKHER